MTRHEVAGDFAPDKWAEYFTYAFVRNPFDRTVSHWAYHVRSRYRGSLVNEYPNLKSMTFEQYVETFVLPGTNKQFLSQVDYVVHPHSNVPIDFIGRFERLEQDCRRLGERLGVQLSELPREVWSNHGHYSEYYDATTEEMVEKAYEADLYAFGYTFEYA